MNSSSRLAISLLGEALLLLIGACARTTHPTAAVEHLSGIPNRPDLVSVVPFYWKPDETYNEQTKVIIPAGVGNAHGNFVLDTGDPELGLNRTFLQPSPTGGVDSVTDANRIPEPPDPHQPVWVTLRLGTLVDTPAGRHQDAEDYGHPVNAFLDHNFGNYAWVFAPRLGNIGLPALKSFETVIDYLHRRVIFIRVDSMGQRLVDVPAYQPAYTIPLVPIRKIGLHWGIRARIGGKIDTLLLDTGAGTAGEQEQRAAIKLREALAAGHSLFDLDAAGVSDITAIPFPGMSPIRILGYAFLHQLSVVGFNFRARQLILYRPMT